MLPCQIYHFLLFPVGLWSGSRRSCKSWPTLSAHHLSWNHLSLISLDIVFGFKTIAVFHYQYQLLKNSIQVRWSSLMDKSVPDPPTAVLLHGILGCRKNWGKLFFMKIWISAGCTSNGIHFEKNGLKLNLGLNLMSFQLFDKHLILNDQGLFPEDWLRSFQCGRFGLIWFLFLEWFFLLVLLVLDSSRLDHRRLSD